MMAAGHFATVDHVVGALARAGDEYWGIWAIHVPFVAAYFAQSRDCGPRHVEEVELGLGCKKRIFPPDHAYR